MIARNKSLVPVSNIFEYHPETEFGITYDSEVLYARYKRILTNAHVILLSVFGGIPFEDLDVNKLVKDTLAEMQKV